MCKLPSNNPNYQTTQPRLPAKHSQTAKLIAMPRKNNGSLMVGISLYLPTQLLDEINEKFSGKNQSEKLRKALLLGLSQATHCEGIKGETYRSLSPPP
jgi:hypothetical protein